MLRRIVAGNWKMHKTAAETAAFFEAFLPHVAGFPPHVSVVVAPPFTAIPTAAQWLQGTRIHLGAQTMHWELKGAFTGEISAPMLLEFGVSHVILGHSERRASGAETDRTVNLEVHTALAHGLTPIVAVGETLQERNAGKTEDRVVSQTRAAFEGVAAGALRKAIVAYEPIWAIGTGKNCAPDEADRVMGAIRAALEGLAETPILYGGSVTPANVATYAARENVNGGLVGGASLDPAGFAKLIAAAVGTTSES
jgi:triosephosphate isomerase (TIM)